MATYDNIPETFSLKLPSSSGPGRWPLTPETGGESGRKIHPVNEFSRRAGMPLGWHALLSSGAGQRSAESGSPRGIEYNTYLTIAPFV